jgi:hypothetical protein
MFKHNLDYSNMVYSGFNYTLLISLVCCTPIVIRGHFFTLRPFLMR